MPTIVPLPSGVGGGGPSSSSGTAATGLNVSEKAKDVRRSNITAAKAVSDAVRTSLGPRGMDKMVQKKEGSVLITNDGATILEQMQVEHPAAKMLVQLSRSQDVVAGDGTTSVVVICGALLSAGLDLLATGIHPSAISDSFALALTKSLAIVKNIAVPVNLDDRDALVKAASTSLNSKVVSEYANLLAPIAVDAVLAIKASRVSDNSTAAGAHSSNGNGSAAAQGKSNSTAASDSSNGGQAAGNGNGSESLVSQHVKGSKVSSLMLSASLTDSALSPGISNVLGLDSLHRGVSSTSTTSFVDLKNIRTVKVVGGTIDDTETIDGLLLNQATTRGGSGAPTRVTNAKVALIQFCLSPPKTDVDNSVVINDYTAMDRILREERQYLLGLCKKIKATGCNVVLIQKSILRDATTDLSLHFLSKMKIMVVRDIERDEVDFISKSLGCVPVADIDTFTGDKLAKVDCVEELSFGDDQRVVRLSGIAKPIKETVSILVRGSNKLVLDEAERSLHDALCVVRSIVHEQYLIPGGAAPETEVSVMLSKAAKALSGVQSHCLEAYAEALNVIAFTLAENAGLPPVNIVTELRRRHAAGESAAGINVRKGTVTNISDENVVMPLLVFSSALSLATECVRQLLKIDDVVITR